MTARLLRGWGRAVQATAEAGAPRSVCPAAVGAGAPRGVCPAAVGAGSPRGVCHAAIWRRV